MALPTSGTISLSQIQSFFGGTNPTSVSEYNKGGGLVPNPSSFNSGTQTSLASNANSSINTSITN